MPVMTDEEFKQLQIGDMVTYRHDHSQIYLRG
jgi:hypothetical protein